MLNELIPLIQFDKNTIVTYIYRYAINYLSAICNDPYFVACRYLRMLSPFFLCLRASASASSDACCSRGETMWGPRCTPSLPSDWSHTTRRCCDHFARRPFSIRCSQSASGSPSPHRFPM